MRLRHKIDENPTREMPFTAHLEELRWHILRSLIYLVIAMCGLWYVYDSWLQSFFFQPIHDAFVSAAGEGHGTDFKLVFSHFLDPFFFKLQVIATVAVLITLPLLLWEIWRFVAPALYKDEKRHLGPLLPFSVVLALLGAMLVYYAVPLAIRFMLIFVPTGGEASGDIAVFQDMQKYYFFYLRMLLGAAIAFQSPLVFMVLGKLELVTARGMMRFWRHAVLINTILAAVITPTPDPINMSIVALPLILLYFLSVGLVWFNERTVRRTREAAELAEAVADAASADATAPSTPAISTEADNPRLTGPTPPPDEPSAPVAVGTVPPPATVDATPAPPADGFEVAGFDEADSSTTVVAKPVDGSALGPQATPSATPAKPAPLDEALFDPDSDI